MAATNENSNRRIVPRWRSFRDAISSQELDPGTIAKTKGGVGGEEFLRSREQEWQDNKELLFATDLISASHVLGPSEVAKEAAEYVLQPNSGASELARRLAYSVLGLKNASGNIVPPSGSGIEEIRRLKRLSVLEPRNAFVWADLARLYVMLGSMLPAARAIRIALALAPFDRFVLRSAARFYLHAGQPDFALQLLRKSEHTKTDPWLMAAEIAISSVLGKDAKSVRRAQAVVENGNISNFHKSELASALASLEMWNGRDKKASRLFDQSLLQPTENALAQGVWASKHVRVNLDQEKFNVPKAYEAQALSAHIHQQWGRALTSAKDWAIDEAFSARPFLHGSSIASSVLQNPQEGEEIAKQGLITNPGHPGLVNNVAFCLVEQGKPQDAARVLDAVDPTTGPKTSEICLYATKGLVAFRLGDPVQGRQLYEKAITEATKQKLQALKARAMLYLAREEARLDPSGASGKLSVAVDECVKAAHSDLIALASLIQKEAIDNRLKNTFQANSTVQA